MSMLADHLSSQVEDDTTLWRMRLRDRPGDDRSEDVPGTSSRRGQAQQQSGAPSHTQIHPTEYMNPS
jgi:hypothetical protein